MMTPDVNVVVIDFKSYKGKEMVSINEDGNYTILINARLSYDGQLKAYEHAMKHIENDDFQENDVQSIEYKAHQEDIEKAESIPAQKYLEKIRELQREKRRLEQRIRRDKKRVQFIIENCDMFKRAEHQYLYGDDL